MVEIAAGTSIRYQGRATGLVAPGKIVSEINANFDKWVIVGSTGLAGVDLLETTGLTNIGIHGDTFTGRDTLITGNTTATGLSNTVATIAALNGDGTLGWKLDDAELVDHTSGTVVYADPRADPNTRPYLVADARTGAKLYSLPGIRAGQPVRYAGIRGDTIWLEDTGTSNAQNSRSATPYHPYKLTDGTAGTSVHTDPLGRPTDGSSASERNAPKFFVDGDPLISHRADYKPGDASMTRSGNHPWKLGTYPDKTLTLIAQNETRLVVFGPTGDLVLIDALTGKQIGKPYTKGPDDDYTDCGGTGLLVTDDEVTLSCEDDSILVRFPN